MRMKRAHAHGFLVAFVALAIGLSTSSVPPARAHAAFTDDQIASIVSVLTAFGVSQGTVAQVQGILNGTSASTSTPQEESCDITENLGVDSTGAQVTCLQQGLIAKAYAIPAIASGYAGYGFFGPETFAAVKEWQSANGISPVSGFFGPVSRARWNATQSSGTTTPPVNSGSGSLTMSLGQSGTLFGTTIRAIALVSDSRCPRDAQCASAGSVLVRTALSNASSTATTTDLALGVPFRFASSTVTLSAVAPEPASGTPIAASAYRFTYTATESAAISYANASAAMLSVGMPLPGMHTATQFAVAGQARAAWFSDGVLPIAITDASSTVLDSTVARANASVPRWRNTLVPFVADVMLPAGYSGRATITFQKANLSGQSANAASVSVPILVE